MAEDEEEERQGPRPANDHGSPNGMSLDPRILRIACSTPKEDCKVRDSFPAFVHGAESLRDNTLIVAKSESPYERRGERHPMPARMQATAEDKQTAEDRPTRDYLETTRAFWQPYAERELTREDAREMARNLIGFFTVLREWTRRERERARCGSLRQLRQPHGGSVEDHARVRRQKIKCSLDAELICSLERGLIQCAVAARGRT